MPRRPLENLTESMFYVLRALKTRPMCGMEIAAFLERATNGRLRIGPATVSYTHLFPVCREMTYARCRHVHFYQRILRALLQVFSPLL